MLFGSPRFLPALLSLLLTGCAAPYYLQAARGQISLLRQRVPIAEVVANPAVDAVTRERLVLVTELRRFAIDELGLPDNDSYTSYVDLGRDAVVWNVVAAGEFSVDPVTWCFPVAGCVAYRGYFSQERAETYAGSLQQRGYDTFVGGSPAYSTLGHFRDPVLSTMLVRSDTELAAMLFHEIAHQQLYVKGDTELSESFATAVEQHAVETWLGSRDATAALSSYRQRLLRQREFAALLGRQRDRLTQVFALAVDTEEMRRRKTAAYAAMRQDYEALRASWDGAQDYAGWFDGGFNNARLVALTSYQRWVPALRYRIDTVGLEAFYQEMESLLQQDDAARLATLEGWDAASARAVLAN